MLCEEKRCLGCFACVNVCHRQAISMVENIYGEVVPHIQADKCINCHACERVCPIMNPTNGSMPNKCFSAWSTDESIRSIAASAGIASTIYKWAIENGGVVFGTKYFDGILKFDYSDSSDNAFEFSGSKYIHAYIGDMFLKAKEFLSAGRLVVFVATPCQIAGLKSFLRIDYNNLILVDILCHGVAPQKYLSEYIKNILKKHYDKVLFRGSHGNCIAVYNNNKPIYVKEKWFDPFSMAYAKGMISRENCYYCPFATLKRQGDITIGDFWGLRKNTLSHDASNIPFVSLVLINTDKGQSVLERVGDRLVLEKQDINVAIKGNAQLMTPCKKHEERENFQSSYLEKGFVESLKSTELYKRTKRENIINIIKAPLRETRKIIKWRKLK